MSIKTKLTLRIIYISILFLLTIFIWRQLYTAQLLEYDKNYGVLIETFLISVLAFSILILLWFKARTFVVQNSFTTILFLFMSSPFTLIFVFYFYHEIFGKLKN